MRELNGRVALVTGASRGIGAAIARALAREGCHVALAARSQEPLEQLAGELHNDYGVRALALPTDMSDTAQVEAMVRRAEAELGRVDILVNNAGLGIYGPVTELREEDLRYVFDVNFFGPVKAMQAVVPGMRQRGEGTIVNISSILGKFAMPLSGGYSASKFALQAISAAARAELAQEHIDVILVCPGLTDTAFAEHSRVSAAGTDRLQGERPSPMRGVPPEKVAERVIRAIREGEREVYVSWYDRLLVGVALAFPGLLDFAMGKVAGIRRQRFAAMLAQAEGKPAQPATVEIRVGAGKILAFLGVVGAVSLALLLGQRKRGP